MFSLCVYIFAHACLCVCVCVYVCIFKCICVFVCSFVYLYIHFNFIQSLIAISGVVTTLAGSGNGAYKDGTRAGASFYYPAGVAVDTLGIY